MLCQKQVIGCFKRLEKWGDRLTGAAGPFFVTFAIVLISMGALSFFDIIYPTLSYKLLTGPLCILIAFNLFTHYYLVCTTPPGFVDAEPMEPATTFPQSWTWARPRKAKYRAANGYRPLETVDAEEGSLEEAGVDEWNITKADMTKCRKCTAMRPERAHHCRICKRCVLKYDHHCPGINQCVGIYNERHFILFMAYLWLSTVLFVLLGYPLFFEALGLRNEAPFPSHIPPILFILSFILSAVLSFAVGVMLIVALWAVMRGETSVEAQDNEVYRKVALSRGEMFGNGYDLGFIATVDDVLTLSFLFFFLSSLLAFSHLTSDLDLMSPNYATLLKLLTTLRPPSTDRPSNTRRGNWV
ncbi:hypothetical protein D9758_014157 [Tetrapyrgos nigripes]|uniref:Palmitoyltransferase n=1 Tax=Tetrapyrgos nigripes TaxID=182062 RepID=A0A8H5CPU4_9AGAR|nr:hypothetical protein D9758_014157 [Tetrapyrgos nigripes]